MAVSLIKKIIHGHPYWYARQCQRVHGRPKVVWQKYLGKAEHIVSALGSPALPAPPRQILLGDFGGPAALFDLCRQLDLVATIDRHAGKRAQGIGVGTYLTLAALNRCLAPTSKAQLAKWYQATVLPRWLPARPSQLTSQRFWDHMDFLDEQKMAAIEQDLTARLLEDFQIDLSCLLYDTTNFYTFIDTFNEAARLPQRGKSKEKRTDLRIVGLALLVTQDYHIPLFHQVYPGNVHDASSFHSVIEQIVARYQLFSKSVEDITVVYDKGNNSEANQQKLDASRYHYVGSLCPTQHPELLAVPRSRFGSLKAEDLEGVRVWRTHKEVLGKRRLIVVAYNPELFQAQSRTLLREMRKRSGKLRQLQHRLQRAKSRLARASVEKQVESILSGRHMKDLFQVRLRQRGGRLRLNYGLHQRAWRKLQRTLLGKNLLFTDQEAWTDEQIVRGYRGQHHIEEAFKRMKNPHFVSWHPLYHWTDQKIRVHAFYCVLALLLSSLLRRSLAKKGLELSIVKILEVLSEIKEVALCYRGEGSKSNVVISYTKLDEQQQRIMAALDLKRFQRA